MKTMKIIGWILLGLGLYGILNGVRALNILSTIPILDSPASRQMIYRAHNLDVVMFWAGILILILAQRLAKRIRKGN